MKLDNWPDEIECEGWKWKRFDSNECKCPDQEDRYYNAQTFYKVKKLHVPPTMKEIMEHLLKGGWVRHDWKEGSALFYRMINQELEVRGNGDGDGDWNPCGDLCRGSFNRVEFFLVKPGDWSVGVAK